MLKQGLFVCGDGRQYTVYEQTVDNFSRIDFCNKDAQFHIDPAGVCFSIVKQKGTFIYGDRSIYNKYLSLLDTAHQFNLPTETSSEWQMGKYYKRLIRAQPSSQFLEETVLCNGVIDSYTVQFGESIYTTSTVAEYSTSRLLPINYGEYTDVSLSTNEVRGDAPYYSLAVLRARYDISHLDSCDFVVADTVEEANRRLQRWLDADVPLKGVDTETTGVDVDMFGTDELVGVVLSWDVNESTYFPFAHKEFPNLPESFLQEKLMPAIRKEEYRCVAHNKKFERKVFLHQGWNIHIKYDTLPLSCMVNPVMEKGIHELKNLMFEATGKKYLELTDIFVSSKLIDFSALPKEIVRLYACPDAANLLHLYPYLWKKLPEDSRHITEVEYDLADVKADQEYYGLRVDTEKFLANLDNCDYTLNLLLKTFRTLTGVDGNINSNELMADLMYGKMQCPVLVRTKTGKPSTGAASVTKLASKKREGAPAQIVTEGIRDKFGNEIITADQLNNAKYPALVVLEKYRIYYKLRSAFYSRFERTSHSGRVFFWVNQNGASSGRQSSPMHQLPSELKDIILPDSPEHDMWDPDYSQIELRMIAFLAGEKELIELCKDPENDIHRAIGSLITGKEMWEISAEERKVGKRRNFGVIYLISAYGLAGQLAGAGYTQEDVKRAETSLDDFYSRFRRIKKYIAQNAEKVQSRGYITTYFGRYKYFPEIFDPGLTSRKRASILRKANNLPVQGTAADYLKLGETNMDRYIRNKGWDQIMPNGFPRVRVGLSIHDEILVMADRTIPYEEIIEMIRTCMELPIPGAPPFFCSPALVDTWAQHDDDSVAMPVKLRDQLIENYHRTGVSVFKQSTYRVFLSDSNRSKIQEALKDVPMPNHKKVLEGFVDALEYEYLSGDNGTEISTAKRLPALMAAVAHQDAIFRDANYLTVLNEYREGVLQKYMQDLVAKYGTDPKEVAPHVRHPSLTHELIARHPAPKSMKLSHTDAILYATTQYIEGNDAAFESVHDTLDITDCEPLVNLDKEGDVVFETETDAVDEDMYDPHDDEHYISELLTGEKVYVWELMDAICIDITGLSKPAADAVIKKVWEQRVPDGFFSVLFLYEDNLVDSKFRVEDIDKIELTEFIKEVGYGCIEAGHPV